MNYYGRIKHLDTKNNFKRDIIAWKENDPEYLPICEMVVDPFMKSIIRNMFFVHVKSLGLCRLWSVWIICHGSLLIGYKILYTW